MAASLGPLLGWPGGRVLLVFGASDPGLYARLRLLGVAYNDALQFVLVIAANGISRLAADGSKGGGWRRYGIKSP